MELNEIMLMIAHSNINLMVEQLDQWNDKKPNDKLTIWKTKLVESEAVFRTLEKEFRITRQRTSELEIKLLELIKTNKELTEQNERLMEKVEL